MVVLVMIVAVAIALAVAVPAAAAVGVIVVHSFPPWHATLDAQHVCSIETLHMQVSAWGGHNMISLCLALRSVLRYANHHTPMRTVQALVNFDQLPRYTFKYYESCFLQLEYIC